MTAEPRKYAIIVSHGQPSAPEPAEAELAEFAARVAALIPDWTVRGATLAMPGALEAALGDSPRDPVIFPMFMSQGWFTQVQLVKRLGDRPARVASPLGVDPGLPVMTAAMLRDILDAEGWHAEETRLFLPAHGSGRSPNAARDTYAFAAALGGLIGFAEMRVGFVEQAPFLVEKAAGLGARAISLPFFAARRGHVLDDVPQALDKAGFSGLRLDPLGCAPQVPALVAQAVSTAAPQAQ